MSQDGPRAGAAAWKRGWHLLAGGYTRVTVGVQPAGSCLPPVLEGGGQWVPAPLVRHVRDRVPGERPEVLQSAGGIRVGVGRRKRLVGSSSGTLGQARGHALLEPRIRVNQRPTSIQSQVPKPPQRASTQPRLLELAPSDVSRMMSIGQRRTLGALSVCPMRCRWELNPTSPPTGRRLWLLLDGARCGVQLSSASGYASSERRLGLCKQGSGSSRPAVVRCRGRRGPSPR